MFPFVTVVECPQDQMIEKIGYTLVGTAITENEAWARELTDATNIDRLNIGPIPTIVWIGCSRTKETSSISSTARGHIKCQRKSWRN